MGQPEAGSRRGSVDLRQAAGSAGVDSGRDLDHGGENAALVGVALAQGLAGFGFGVIARRYDQGSVLTARLKSWRLTGSRPGTVTSAPCRTTA